MHGCGGSSRVSTTVFDMFPLLSVLLCVAASTSKTNKNGKKEYWAMMRNKDVGMCGVGALAMYLFHRLQEEGEEWDYSSRSSWYFIKVC